MKLFALLTLLLFNYALHAQGVKNKLIGNYHDLFGSQLEIKADSTFNYAWYFDMASSWSRGTWHMKNDTLYLKTILVYDTLRLSKPDGRIADSLILSADKQSARITSLNTTNVLSSGGQNRLPGPKKLFFKNEKLIGIDKQGKLFMEKVKGILNLKKRRTWYIKEKR